MWLGGSLPRNRRWAGVEMLGHGFVTVTGAALGGRGRALGTLGPVLEQLGGVPRPRPGRLPPSGTARSSSDCTRLPTAPARGPCSGDWAGLGYCSPSEADLAAARMLRFYCTDPEQLRRLMEATALRRDKWGCGDYLERTIRRALELGGPVWQGPAG